MNWNVIAWIQEWLTLGKMIMNQRAQCIIQRRYEDEDEKHDKKYENHTHKKPSAIINSSQIDEHLTAHNETTTHKHRQYQRFHWKIETIKTFVYKENSCVKYL